MKNKIKYALNVFGIVIASLLLLFMAVVFIVSKVLLDDMFCRTEVDVALMTDYTDEEMEARGLTRRAVSFDSEGNTLYGNVWGDTSGNKLVVIAHGIGSYANAYYNEMEYFVENGYCVLTYNCTGTFTSEGKGTTGLSQSPTDLHNALLFVESDPVLKDKEVYLFGHSWGGHAVTAVLNFEHKNIKAVASVAGYNSNAGIMFEWMKNKMGMGGGAYIIFPFASICSYPEAHGNYNYTGVGGINKADIPVIAIQGGKDETVLEDSIYSHYLLKDIKSDKFRYEFIKQGTHSGVLNTDDEAKLDYQKQTWDKYEELETKHNGNIPEDDLKAFYANIDKDKYNGVNNKTMTYIKNFFADPENYD